MPDVTERLDSPDTVATRVQAHLQGEANALQAQAQQPSAARDDYRLEGHPSGDDLTAGWAEFGNDALSQALKAQGISGGAAAATCGPIAAAGLARAFGIDTDPAKLARIGLDNGWWAPGVGMELGSGVGVQKLLATQGLSTDVIPASADSLARADQALQRGVPVILNFPNHYLLAQAERQTADGQTEYFVGNTGANALGNESAQVAPGERAGDWLTLAEMNAHPGDGGAIRSIVLPTADVLARSQDPEAQARLDRLSATGSGTNPELQARADRQSVLGAAATGQEPLVTRPDTSSRAATVSSIEPLAQYWSQKTGIPPEVLIAINIHEGGNGVMAAPFGIKGSSGSAGGTSQATFEYDAAGNRQDITDTFRSYKSLNDAYHDFFDFVQGPRYRDVWDAFQAGKTDWKGFLDGIVAKGYATDKAWGSHIANFAAGSIAPLMGHPTLSGQTYDASSANAADPNDPQNTYREPIANYTLATDRTLHPVVAPDEGPPGPATRSALPDDRPLYRDQIDYQGRAASQPPSVVPNAQWGQGVSQLQPNPVLVAAPDSRDAQQLTGNPLSARVLQSQQTQSQAPWMDPAQQRDSLQAVVEQNDWLRQERERTARMQDPLRPTGATTTLGDTIQAVLTAAANPAPAVAPPPLSVGPIDPLGAITRGQPGQAALQVLGAAGQVAGYGVQAATYGAQANPITGGAVQSITRPARIGMALASTLMQTDPAQRVQMAVWTPALVTQAVATSGLYGGLPQSTSAVAQDPEHTAAYRRLLESNGVDPSVSGIAALGLAALFDPANLIPFHAAETAEKGVQVAGRAETALRTANAAQDLVRAAKPFVQILSPENTAASFRRLGYNASEIEQGMRQIGVVARDADGLDITAQLAQKTALQPAGATTFRWSRTRVPVEQAAAMISRAREQAAAAQRLVEQVPPAVLEQAVHAAPDSPEARSVGQRISEAWQGIVNRSVPVGAARDYYGPAPDELAAATRQAGRAVETRAEVSQRLPVQGETDFWRQELGANPKALAKADATEAGLERLLAQNPDPSPQELRQFAGPVENVGYSETVKYTKQEKAAALALGKDLPKTVRKQVADFMPYPTPVRILSDMTKVGLRYGYDGWYAQVTPSLIGRFGRESATEANNLFTTFGQGMAPETATRALQAVMIAARENDWFRPIMSLKGPERAKAITEIVNATYRRITGEGTRVMYPVSFQSVGNLYAEGMHEVGSGAKLGDFGSSNTLAQYPWLDYRNTAGDKHMARAVGFLAYGDMESSYGLETQNRYYRYVNTLMRHVGNLNSIVPARAQAAIWGVQKLMTLPIDANAMVALRRLNPTKTAEIDRFLKEGWGALANGLREGKVSEEQAFTEMQRMGLLDYPWALPGGIDAAWDQPAIFTAQKYWDEHGYGAMRPPIPPRGGFGYAGHPTVPQEASGIRYMAQNPLNQRAQAQAPTLALAGSPDLGIARRLQDLPYPNTVVESGGDFTVALPTINQRAAPGVAQALADDTGRTTRLIRMPSAGEDATAVQWTLDRAHIARETQQYSGLEDAVLRIRAQLQGYGADVHFNGRQMQILLDTAKVGDLEAATLGVRDAVQSAGLDPRAMRVGGRVVETYQPRAAAALESADEITAGRSVRDRAWDYAASLKRAIERGTGQPLPTSGIARSRLGVATKTVGGGAYDAPLAAVRAERHPDGRIARWADQAGSWFRRMYHGTKREFEVPDILTHTHAPENGPTYYLAHDPGTSEWFSGTAASGAQTRIVDVPEDLQLLPSNRDLPPEEVRRIAEIAASMPGADDKTATAVANLRDLAGQVDGDMVMSFLRQAVPQSGPTDAMGKGTWAQEVLGQAGYQGTQRLGAEHEIGIWPNTMPKIRNALSGREMGQVDLRLAQAFGQMAAGGYGAYRGWTDTPDDASVGEHLKNAALLGGGAFLGASALSLGAEALGKGLAGTVERLFPRGPIVAAATTPLGEIDAVLQASEAARAASRPDVREVLTQVNEKAFNRFARIWGISELVRDTIPTAVGGSVARTGAVLWKDFSPVLQRVATEIPDGLTQLNRYLLANQVEDITIREMQFAQGITADTAKQALKELAQELGGETVTVQRQTGTTTIRNPKWELLKQAANDLYRLQEQHGLGYAQDASVFAPEQIAAMQRDNPHFFPHLIVDEKGNSAVQGGTESLSVRTSGIYKREGSTKAIEQPLTAMIHRLYALRFVADRNLAGSTIIDGMIANPNYRIDALRTADQVRQRISLFSDNKVLRPVRDQMERMLQTRWQWADRLYSAIADLEQRGLNASLKAGAETSPAAKLRSSVNRSVEYRALRSALVAYAQPGRTVTGNAVAKAIRAVAEKQGLDPSEGGPMVARALDEMNQAVASVRDPAKAQASIQRAAQRVLDRFGAHDAQGAMDRGPVAQSGVRVRVEPGKVTSTGMSGQGPPPGTFADDTTDAMSADAKRALDRFMAASPADQAAMLDYWFKPALVRGQPSAKADLISAAGTAASRKRMLNDPEKLRQMMDVLITGPNWQVQRLKKLVAGKESALSDLLDEITDLHGQYLTHKETIIQNAAQGRLLKDGTLPPGMEKISRLKDGIREDYAVPTVIAGAVKQLDAQSAHWFLKMLSALNAPSRIAYTVASPAFLMNNIVRDTFDRFIRRGRIPDLDYIWGLYAALTHNHDYQAAMQAGVGLSGLSEMMGRQSAEQTVQQLAKAPGQRAVETIRNPFTLMQKINEVAEQGPKIGDFLHYRDQNLLGIPGLKYGRGNTVVHAGAEARVGTVDYWMGGSFAKAANGGVMFLNANLQAFKNIAEPFGPYRSKADRALAMARLALMATGVGAIYAWNANRIYQTGARAGEPMWDDIPSYDRDYRVVIITGETTDEQGRTIPDYLALPLPTSLVPFNILLREWMAAQAGKRTRPALEIGSAIMTGTSPIAPADVEGTVIPPVVGVPREISRNWSDYRQANIEPPEWSDPHSPGWRPRPDRAFPSTSKTAALAVNTPFPDQVPLVGGKTVGDLTGYSPVQAEYLGHNVAAGPYDTATWLADRVLAQTHVIPPLADTTDAVAASRFPFTRGIFRARGGQRDADLRAVFRDQVEQNQIVAIADLRKMPEFQALSPDEQDNAVSRLGQKVYDATLQSTPDDQLPTTQSAEARRNGEPYRWDPGVLFSGTDDWSKSMAATYGSDPAKLERDMLAAVEQMRRWKQDRSQTPPTDNTFVLARLAGRSRLKTPGWKSWAVQHQQDLDEFKDMTDPILQQILDQAAGTKP